MINQSRFKLETRPWIEKISVIRTLKSDGKVEDNVEHVKNHSNRRIWNCKKKEN